MGLKGLGEVALEVKSLPVMNDHLNARKQSYYKVRNNARNQYNHQH